MYGQHGCKTCKISKTEARLSSQGTQRKRFEILTKSNWFSLACARLMLSSHIFPFSLYSLIFSHPSFLSLYNRCEFLSFDHKMHANHTIVRLNAIHALSMCCKSYLPVDCAIQSLHYILVCWLIFHVIFMSKTETHSLNSYQTHKHKSNSPRSILHQELPTENDEHINATVVEHPCPILQHPCARVLMYEVIFEVEHIWIVWRYLHWIPFQFHSTSIYCLNTG